MTRIRKGYVAVGSGQVHFRYAGSGAPVVLLHDSPRSSVLHEPLLRALAPHALVIALDTPGYGHSTPLTSTVQPTIADFADTLAETLTALGIARCPIYGTHTSSKILLELCLRHPERVERAVMDGLSLPTSLASEGFIERYMAPFVVQADGSHFASLWSRARDIHRFFPWFDLSARARLGLDLPDADGLNLYFLDMLMAGPHYSAAYSAAMRHPAIRRIEDLRTPIAVMCRSNDPLYAYLDALPTTLPAGSTIDRLGPDHEAWLAAVEKRLLGGSKDNIDLPSSSGSRNAYASLPGDLQLHFSCSGQGAGRPIVLLPEQPGSAVVLRDLATKLAEHRVVYCIDLPGIGESDPLSVSGSAPSSTDFGATLRAFIDSQGVAEVDVFAAFTAAPLALEWARQDSRVRHVVLDGVPLKPARAAPDFEASYCPPLRAQRDGSHWLAIWHQLRDQYLAWPWHDGSAAAARRTQTPPDTDVHHANVVEVGRQLEHYGDAARAAWRVSSARGFEGVAVPVEVWLDVGDVRVRAAVEVIGTWPGVSRTARPCNVGEQAQRIEAFTSARDR